MKWPIRVQVIVDTLAAGIPHSAPDDERRAVTQKIAEQCCYELGRIWGTKRSAPGYPNSTDVFCLRSPFIGWDWSVPSGIAQFPESIDLIGQVFVQVAPFNHLALPPVPVPVPEPPAPEPVPPDLAPILVRLNDLERRMAAHESVPPPVCPPLPDYVGTGKLFGVYSFTVRSKPVV